MDDGLIGPVKQEVDAGEPALDVSLIAGAETGRLDDERPGALIGLTGSAEVTGSLEAGAEKNRYTGGVVAVGLAIEHSQRKAVEDNRIGRMAGGDQLLREGGVLRWSGPRCAAFCANSRSAASTAHALVGDQARLLAAGFDAVVTKPINTRTFGAEVTRLARSRGARA